VSKLRIIQVDSFGSRSAFHALLQPLPHIKRIYVISIGGTVLCCCDNSRTVLPGNVAQFSLAAVWNSDA
jgi:hypothetical protein